MSHTKVEIKYKGTVAWCYGEIKPNSNFEVIASDEAEDGIVSDIEGKTTWKQVVEYLVDCEKFPSGIEQVEAV